MRRRLQFTGLAAVTVALMLVTGGFVFTQIVMLGLLALAVVLAAVAFSVQRGFRLLERSSGPRRPAMRHHVIHQRWQ
jgi:hypothetical protein